MLVMPFRFSRRDAVVIANDPRDLRQDILRNVVVTCETSIYFHQCHATRQESMSIKLMEACYCPSLTQGLGSAAYGVLTI